MRTLSFNQKWLYARESKDSNSSMAVYRRMDLGLMDLRNDAYD
jgi:hypothetical protein